MDIQKRELFSARTLACAVLLCLISSWAGFYARERLVAGALVLPAKSLPLMEDLSAPESFSRVQNNKKSLEALCVRFRLEVQSRFISDKTTLPPQENRAQIRVPVLEHAIRDLEVGMQEFQGTEQELDLAQELLFMLKRAKRFDRWTVVYLDALYQHPTHRIVALFANEAIAIGRLAGREQDVVAGLKHVSAIPLDFEDKDTIRAALE